MVSSEGMSLINPVKIPGIDPGTVRLVAQRLNHYATPGPKQTISIGVHIVAKQDRQYNYNVTLGSVRATFVAVEK
jgi:hypothetical protein